MEASAAGFGVMNSTISIRAAVWPVAFPPWSWFWFHELPIPGFWLPRRQIACMVDLVPAFAPLQSQLEANIAHWEAVKATAEAPDATALPALSDRRRSGSGSGGSASSRRRRRRRQHRRVGSGGR